MNSCAAITARISAASRSWRIRSTKAADGRRYLVVHGDIFDLVVTQARWLALLGDKAYEFALTANRVFNAFRRMFGAPYWSLSKWAKLKVKNAVNYIGAFEKALATEAKHHHADGVICGHIHTAAMHDDYGLRYINCGDWVESCTAVAEREDGQFEIITWTQAGRSAQSQPMSTRPSRRQHDRAWPRQPHERNYENSGRHRCLAPAGQRRGAHAGAVAREARALGAELEFLGARRVLDAADAELSGNPAGAGRGRAISSGGSSAQPDAIHIATEGPLGHAMRRVCLRRGLPFTTSFHTRFPDYLAGRLPVPERWTCDVTWGWLRRFHCAGAAVLAATPTLASELATRGFKNVKLWSRGVDADLFRPRAEKARFAAADFSDGRAPGGRKKSRGLSQARSARHESWWSARGRRAAHWRESFLTRYFSARGTARRWLRSMRPPMCSCFRAAPTRSAWCCWKRWRAACRWLHSRRRRPATSSGMRMSGFSTTTFSAPVSVRWTVRGRIAANLRSA